VTDGSYMPFWCFWKEINDRSFKNRKWTLEEIKSFKTMYHRTIAFISPLTINYSDFLILFALSS
jgi:hypothetical protein